MLLRNAVTLSLASIKAVVAARETSRNSRDFTAADAIRVDMKAQYAQQEYVHTHSLRSDSRPRTCKARATGGESLRVPPSHDCKREVTVDE